MHTEFDTLENEQEWQWCLVGNIVEAHEYGKEHTIKHGNKQFRPNAKVFINLVYGGMGHERILVIGMPRNSPKYIEIVIARKYVHNFRIQRVFKPAVLERMKKSDWNWWGNTDEERDKIDSLCYTHESRKTRFYKGYRGCGKLSDVLDLKRYAKYIGTVGRRDCGSGDNGARVGENENKREVGR